MRLKTTLTATLLLFFATFAHAEPLTIKGSDTMVIMIQRMAEEFMKAHPDKVLQVTGGGSGTGLSALENGTTVLAMASRPIKDKEKEAIKTKFGTEVVETKIALDGITVYANGKNPVKELTMSQVADLYLGKITNWKDVGGNDAKVILYGRENNSGTYAYFKEHVLKDKDYAPRTQTLPGTGAVVNAVSSDKNGVGYGGAAYSKGVKEIAIKKDENSPAVLPKMANIVDNSYPLSRYLYIYSVGSPKGIAKDFLEYATSPAGQAIAQKVGYFPLPTQK